MNATDTRDRYAQIFQANDVGQPRRKHHKQRQMLIQTNRGTVVGR